MKALITGASNGMGKSAAKYLDELGYDLILVSRNEKRLLELKKEFKNDVKVISMDLSKEENLYKLYEEVKEENIDLLMNNAGFGLFGEFVTTDLNEELNMIDLNLRAYHILTKLFLKDMCKRDSGRILNTVSMAGLMPGGPLLNTYYATKAYVLSLDNAIYQELKMKKSNVHISSFCPGPVNTGFNDRANVTFSVKGIESDYAAKYAVDNALKNKMIIVPSFKMRVGIFISRFLSKKFILKFAYKMQQKKMLN